MVSLREKVPLYYLNNLQVKGCSIFPSNFERDTLIPFKVNKPYLRCKQNRGKI